MYMTVKVVRGQDFLSHIGFHQFFDLVDFDKVELFQVNKYTNAAELKRLLAEKWGVSMGQ